ncbi:MAG TPA: hypothetical protein VKF40_13355 [Burkholderiales bacterium]|nr:hypothetical protein [Burkholderiales bacterium]
MPERTSIRWSFVRHADGGWLWQLFGPDGRLEKTSAQHSTYGKALLDALARGFKPSDHDYSIDLPHGRLHYPPGRDPEFVSLHPRPVRPSLDSSAEPDSPELTGRRD